MLNHIKAIIKACDKLNLEYNILHKSQNVLEIKTPKQNLLFTNGITPFNSESVANICRDKDFTYTLFHNDLNLPKTVSFFDPNGGEEYKSYIEFKSHQIICEQIINQFSFPVIVKRNSGSQGKNVCKFDAVDLSGKPTAYIKIVIQSYTAIKGTSSGSVNIFCKPYFK